MIVIAKIRLIGTLWPKARHLGRSMRPSRAARRSSRRTGLTLTFGLHCRSATWSRSPTTRENCSPLSSQQNSSRPHGLPKILVLLAIVVLRILRATPHLIVIAYNYTLCVAFKFSCGRRVFFRLFFCTSSVQFALSVAV
jgi:hypothetical protein